jgi:acyl-CoA synthetase (AMP-forming)/AMP-acid ligase II
MSDPIAAGRAARQALHDARNRPLLFDHSGRERTGGELEWRVERVAGALADQGLAGRRIGVAYRNSMAAFEAFLAVEWVGATRVTVDPDVPPAEARSVFDAAGVDTVLTDEEHAHTLDAGALVHDDNHPLQGDRYREQPTVAGDTPLVVYPRSVAAGQLFGVTTSYANWEEILRINCELFRHGWYGPPADDRDKLLTVQQLMHGTGMVASFPFLLMGLPQVVMPKFNAQTVLEIIESHTITSLFAVPGMLQRLADQLDDAPADLPLRHTLYGGAPLEVDELRRVRRVLGGSLVQLYGRFEAGWPLTVLGPDEHARILHGDDDLASSCGKFIPQIEVRLAEAPGRPDGHGELQTRNPMVSPQYADPDGWCALGDVAYLDNDGYVHLAGRLDNMINTGSYHVYPEQVAEAIRGVAGVTETRVVGEPDPVWGQAVTAYVVPDDPSRWDELVEALHVELPTKLARYKIPKAYRQVAELP